MAFNTGWNQNPQNAQNNYANLYGQIMSNPNMNPQQQQTAMTNAQQNPQPAPWTPATQMNALTGGAYSAQTPMTTQPGVPQQPMRGMGAGVGMAQPYGGGVGGLARFYTR